MSRVNTNHRIAYIMSRFPGLSETFILREMCELERLGWQLELFPLIYQDEKIVHEEAQIWLPRAQRPRLQNIIIDNLRFLINKPALYLSTFLLVISGNIYSPNFLIRGLLLFPLAIWMANQMKKLGITHIHAHYATHPALVAWIINRITDIPYGITVHAHDIYINQSMLLPKVQNAQYVIAISRYNKKFLADLYGSDIEKKIDVIHCGIIPDKYDVRKTLSKEDTTILNIMSIGSLRPYKGFTYLLDACFILKQRKLSFRCSIIGGGELKQSLLEKIKKLDLGDVVELLGPKNQSEVAELLQKADLYIQPSIVLDDGRMEGIPVSLMEAMASNIPVIATDISGISELVQHGETGWLIPPEEPTALADTVMEIYNNKTDAIKRANAGKKLVLSEFNVRSTTTSLSNIFHNYSA